jgi:hypothetical protein
MPSEVQKSFKALVSSINLMSIDLLYGKFGTVFPQILLYAYQLTRLCYTYTSSMNYMTIFANMRVFAIFIFLVVSQ